MKKKYVVYEIWTTSRIVEADSIEDAYDKGEPPSREGLSLANWHVAVEDNDQASGALNYRQVK